jgi:phosphate/sulfate permease
VDFYILALIVLLVLAVLDLSVGVANDAVNFLNSAIGARAARLRTLLLIAAAGVLFGSLLSSGMMEVARSGIFRPEAFTFHDVIVIFVAVMIADVLLLDAFNTLGLPTSTTVSLVFELLGAALVVALLKGMALGEPLAALEGYINGAGALRIIGGIVLSVGIAFATGLAVMWFSRLLFTFRPERHQRAVHLAWAGIALALIGYFLVVKGLKSSPLLPEWVSAWFGGHPLLALAGLAAGGVVLARLVEALAGIEPMRFVVLVGTFALATAFASNDLVNFVGVPLAGYGAWEAWSASGVSADAFAMDALNQPVRGQAWLLFAAGVVMALTLWLSNKARSVTQTEVDLARQGAGHERFRPGPVSRVLLGLSLRLFDVLKPIVPQALAARIEQRFEPAPPARASAAEAEAPAFDMVRGSVNLAVASCLIALATTLKLPLSTTFVTFMVAMGSSLADRSWGRDSAVYRIAGVASVLAGWFLTALVAAVTAGVFAAVLWHHGTPGLAGLVLLLVVVLVSTTRWHRRRAARQARAAVAPASLPRRYQLMLGQAARLLRRLADAGDPRGARGVARAARAEQRFVAGLQADAIAHARRSAESTRGALLRLAGLERRTIEAVAGVAGALEAHLLNLHQPLSAAQRHRWHDLLAECAVALQAVADAIPEPTPLSAAAARIELARVRLGALQAEELADLGADDGAPPPLAARLVLRAADAAVELVDSSEQALASLRALHDAEPRPSPVPAA